MNYRLMAACGCTTGRRRQNNEDNFWFDGRFLEENNEALSKILVQKTEPGQIADYCIFDGMGGQADGQVASYLAAKTFDDVRQRAKETDARRFHAAVTKEMADIVWKRAYADVSDLGTTGVMLRLEHDQYHLCNVGDSRIYLYRDKVLSRISLDHTDEEFLKQNQITGRKPRLTQYIGISPDELIIEPYQAGGEIRKGDYFLLCSDGLTDMVSEEEIRRLLSAEESVGLKTRHLIEAAMEQGGRDNTTVILVHVGDTGSKMVAAESKRTLIQEKRTEKAAKTEKKEPRTVVSAVYSKAEGPPEVIKKNTNPKEEPVIRNSVPAGNGSRRLLLLFLLLAVGGATFLWYSGSKGRGQSEQRETEETGSGVNETETTVDTPVSAADEQGDMEVPADSIDEQESPGVLQEEIEEVPTVPRPWVGKERGDLVEILWEEQEGVSGYEVGVSESQEFTNVSLYEGEEDDEGIWIRFDEDTDYFIRVRAYQDLGNREIYGEWSKTLGLRR